VHNKKVSNLNTVLNSYVNISSGKQTNDLTIITDNYLRLSIFTIFHLKGAGWGVGNGFSLFYY
jgi:hypothetical protein